MEKIPHTLENWKMAIGVSALALGSLAMSSEVMNQTSLARVVYVHENNAMPQLAPEPQKRKMPFPKHHGFQARLRK